jgi:hypothetical protein
LNAIETSREKILNSEISQAEDRGVSMDSEDISVQDCMKAIVAEIDEEEWLTAEERNEIKGTFVADLASRYTQLEQFINSQLNPMENKRLILRILKQIRNIRSAALKACQKKRAKMDQIGIFNQELNSGRMVSLFRVELNKRIDMKDIMEKAQQYSQSRSITRDNSRVAGMDTIENIMKDSYDLETGLNMVTHPTPKLDPPSEMAVAQFRTRRGSLYTKTKRLRAASRFIRRASMITKDDNFFKRRAEGYGEVLIDLQGILKKQNRWKRNQFDDSDGDDSEDDSDVPDWMISNEDKVLRAKVDAIDNPLLRAHAELAKTVRPKFEPLVICLCFSCPTETDIT